MAHIAQECKYTVAHKTGDTKQALTNFQNSFTGRFSTQHTHPFNGPFSGTTQVSRYQKGKNNLDFTEARDSEWQWNLLDRMQVCTSLQTDNHASTPPLSFFTGRMPFLSPNQQCQSTEGKRFSTKLAIKLLLEIPPHHAYVATLPCSRNE